MSPYRIGILTAGGDCPGLNAAIRGVAKAAYERIPGLEIYGISDGFAGLISGTYRAMQKSDFSGILNIGGTILGAARTPFSKMREIEGEVDKVAMMKQNYNNLKLDCLLTLGGNGTHKTANLLSEEGLNVIGLPKTIDNDIWGTDITFGFSTAVDTATHMIDKLHTTASSHGRTIVIEIMGNKSGRLTLHSGLAGGADVIIIPEVPFEYEKIAEAVMRRNKHQKTFSIIAIAEGAIDSEEVLMKKKERLAKREKQGNRTLTAKLTQYLNETTGVDTRSVIPAHILRGGSPSPYDRLLATRFGIYAAELLFSQTYGVTVAKINNMITHNRLCDVAGKTKLVPPDSQILTAARHMGISFGD